MQQLEHYELEFRLRNDSSMLIWPCTHKSQNFIASRPSSSGFWAPSLAPSPPHTLTVLSNPPLTRRPFVGCEWIARTAPVCALSVATTLSEATHHTQSCPGRSALVV